MAAVDPGAIYNTTIADLNQQSAWQDAQITENLGFTETGITNAEQGLTREEAPTYRNEANRANKGGLMTSGINARRKGELAANFEAKRAGNQLNLAKARAAAKRAEEGVGLKKTQGEHTAGVNLALGQNALTAANPGVEPYPTVPGQAASRAPAGPGGVVPYGFGANPIPGGSGNVRVGLPLRKQRK